MKYSIQIIWGLTVPLLLTAISWIFRSWLVPNNILLIYLLGVFILAIQCSLFSSILAALISAMSFAFFFAVPIFSLKIYGVDNIIGLIIMLVVAIMTSNLTEKLRNKTQIIIQKEQRALSLYQLSLALAEAQTAKQLLINAQQHIYQEFKRLNYFLIPDNHQILNNRENNNTLSIDLELANLLFKTKQTESKTQKNIQYIPLNSSLGLLGVLAIESKQLNLEQQEFFNIFLAQIIHALEKITLAEQARNANLKMQTEALKNSLLSSISHDLRTPLTIIISAANNLEENNLNTTHNKKLISAINEEAQRILNLTSKLLEMAKLETGEVILNKEWYPPEEIIGSALHALNKRLQHRTINLHIADNLALIYVDAVLIQQVLINLLDNADKYSPIGQTIELFVENNNNDLTVLVMDNGIGIPENLQEKIFDKFFRLHQESNQSGVGLGLAICRAIIQAHGGKIRATNRKEGGLIVEFNIPNLTPPPNLTLFE